MIKEMTYTLRLFLVAALLFGQARAEEAQNYQSLTELRDFVSTFVKTQIGPSETRKVEVTVAQLDPRLHLYACPKEQLEAYLPHNMSAAKASLIGVRCGSDKPWQVIIPVHIQVLEQVVVAKHPLSIGQKVSAADVELKEVDVNSVRGYFSNADLLNDKVLTHAVATGQVVTPDDLKAELLVSRGDSVTIIAQQEGINISMPGTAAQNGALGETITIRNSSSNRLIQAKVVGNKAVQVVF